MKAAEILPVLCILLSACSRTPPPAAPPAPASALTLSIVASEDYPQPNDHGERMLFNGESQMFYVVLANHSNTPATICEEWNSMGWGQLSFIATLPDGTVVDLRKRPRSWSRNFFSTFTIPPGGYYVFPEHFDKKRGPICRFFSTQKDRSLSKLSLRKGRSLRLPLFGSAMWSHLLNLS